MSKRIAWTLLRGLTTPNGNFTLRQELTRGLEAFNLSLGPAQGTYALEIGMTRVEGSGLDRLPSTDELKNEWNIVAKDRLAETELALLETAQESQQQKQELRQLSKMIQEMQMAAGVAEDAYEAAQRAASSGNLTEDLAQVLSEAKLDKESCANMVRLARLLFRSVFSKKNHGDQIADLVHYDCKIDTLLASMPKLSDDQLIASIVTEVEKTVPGEVQRSDKESSVIPRVKAIFDTIAAKLTANGITPNKYFILGTTSVLGYRPDLIFTQREEAKQHYGNTLFYFEAKRVGALTETQHLLQDAIYQIVLRILERHLFGALKHNFGLGIVSNGNRVQIVKLDLLEGRVYVSEEVELKSEEGLGALARMMGCKVPYRFGLNKAPKPTSAPPQPKN